SGSTCNAALAIKDIGLRPLVFWGQRPSGRVRSPAGGAGKTTATTGTPRPRTFHAVTAGHLACGSSASSCLPEAEGFSGAIWTKARRLQLRGQLRLCLYLAHRIPS